MTCGSPALAPFSFQKRFSTFITMPRSQERIRTNLVVTHEMIHSHGFRLKIFFNLRKKQTSYDSFDINCSYNF